MEPDPQASVGRNEAQRGASVCPRLDENERSMNILSKTRFGRRLPTIAGLLEIGLPSILVCGKAQDTARGKRLPRARE